jgi:hypothetical protein
MVFSYYAYKWGIYQKLFEYFKLFVFLTFSAKFASTTGVFLEKIHLFNADSYTILILIGFMFNLAFIVFGSKYMVLFINHFINSTQIKIFMAKLLTLLEVIIIVTFIYYMFMQLTISKQYLHGFVKKSFSYTYIKHFYMGFLNHDFAAMILYSDTKTNHKEVLFRSFKNAW